MPRTPTRTATAEQPPPGNSLIASAANLTRSDLRPKAAGATTWQTEAWNLYDQVGELRFAGNWMRNALSRVTLHAIKRDKDGNADPVDNGPAADAVADLYGGPTGQSQMMASLGVHLTIGGESYLVGVDPDDDEAHDEWMVLSTEEIRGRGGRWTVERGDGQRRALPDSALIIRIWRPHPRKWVEADSSVRAVLPVLRELVGLAKHVGAAIDSRLAGAGIFFVPSEMTFSAPPGTPPADPMADPFLAQLAETMMAAIEDQASPSALVPIVIKAPAATIGAAQHLTFETPLDAQAQSLREEAIRRLSLGLDMPPEVLTGQSDSNHWSAWQIDEAGVKVHVEPTCELIADALTRQFLWPALAGVADRYSYEVGYDTADLRTRPNHAAEAVELFDRLEIGPAALLRETGFDDGDKPTPQELQDMLTRKLAVTPGDLQASAVKSLGVADVEPPAVEPWPTQQGWGSPAEEVEPVDQRALPSEPSGMDDQQVASLLTCAEVLAVRAFERANNRVSHRGRRRPCDEATATAALVNEWGMVGQVARTFGVNPDVLRARLNTYVTALLISGSDHDPDALRRVLLIGTGDG